MMHELAHAIFDIEASAASLDFVEGEEKRQYEEVRAHAFAQESLAPAELLNHIARTNGLKWDALSPFDLALLVAYTQVELRVVLKSAVDSGFIGPETSERYLNQDIHAELKKLTERALSTQEFIDARGIGRTSLISASARTATIPSRPLRLPLPYVAKIIDLVRNSDISLGKAAQMLMVDRDVFLQRFGHLLLEVAA